MCRYICWLPEEELVPPLGTVSMYKAGVILLNQENRFILVRNYCSGKWTFPKGSIEEGETVQEAATRELFEETGIVVDIESLKLYHKYYKQTYFLCNAGNIDYDEKQIKDKSEITGIGWFCFEHLEELELARPTLNILRRIYADINPSLCAPNKIDLTVEIAEIKEDAVVDESN